MSNCGTWTYGGVTKRVNSFLKPQIVTSTATHFHVTWNVAAQCCEDPGAELFPCGSLIDDKSEKAEQAFSTACEYKKKIIKFCKNQ